MRRRTPELSDTALTRLAALAADLGPARAPIPPGPAGSGAAPAARSDRTGEWIVAPAPPRPLAGAERTDAVPPEDAGPDGATESAPAAAADARVRSVDALTPAASVRWDRSVPAVLRGARLDPGRRGVAALAAVTLVAALVAGVSAWRARPQEVPVSAPAMASSSPSAAAEVVVAVSGRVRTPGLVRLPVGSRVADAVKAAGGAVPGADLGTLNLARKLVDGELVVVGAPAPDGVAPPGGTAAPAPKGALLDLNTATVAQLDALPGVGAVLAERIVAYRTENGGFRSVQQLREVEGIGDTRFERLKDRVTV